MGQARIRPVTYQPPPGTPAHGIEVLTLRELRGRVGATELVGPQCPQFHLLTLVTDGSGTHSIDFTDHALHPGVVWWTRPGQVQQWGDVHRYEGILVLFEHGALAPGTVAALTANHVRRRASWDLAQHGHHTIANLFAHLAAVSATPTPTGGAVLAHTLAALLLSLEAIPDPHQPGGAAAAGSLLTQFEHAVEQRFRTTRTVADYAHVLGFSEKTLTRAVRAATGLTAKQYIDGRVTLEAKRLLAHSKHSTAAIAAALGFEDASNFAKFFSTRTGTTPGAFRGGDR